MSILIKGMEMPKSCRACPLATRFFDGEDVCSMLGTYVHDRDREDDCPLGAVPPHGRLIDADEFLKRAIGTKCFRGDYALMLEELVGESTTIILAEEGE